MKYIALILVLAVPALRSAPVQTQQTITVDKVKKLEARFLLYLTADYQKKEDAQWPLMMFLHGAGERGCGRVSPLCWRAARAAVERRAARLR